MRRLLLVLAVIALMLSPSTAGAEDMTATAELKNADGGSVGTATLVQGDEGGVRLTVEVAGLEAGQHGIHFHETGQCDPPDFKSAGAHFNPTDAMHGLDNPEGPHAGDLPNLEVSEDGAASFEEETDRVTLGTGDLSLLDTDGSALVIHADEDDQVTDPSGESGDRIACGVIVGSPDVPDTGAGGTASAGSPLWAGTLTMLAGLLFARVLLARRVVAR